MKKIAVKTVYMEMKSKKTLQYEFDDNVRIEKFENIDRDYYLKVYKLIGEKWGWTGRLLLSEEDLEKKLSEALIYIVYYNGDIVGFTEFEKDKGNMEIVYFGLRPDYIGKGIGKNFLNYSITKVWDDDDFDRLWLHTCEHDHPRAVRVYEKAGFKIYKESIDYEYYPEDFAK